MIPYMIRTLKEFQRDEVFWDVISAEVDQTESPLSSPLTSCFHLNEHMSKLKQIIKKDSFKTTMLSFLIEVAHSDRTKVSDHSLYHHSVYAGLSLKGGR